MLECHIVLNLRHRLGIVHIFPPLSSFLYIPQYMTINTSEGQRKAGREPGGVWKSKTSYLYLRSQRWLSKAVRKLLRVRETLLAHSASTRTEPAPRGLLPPTDNLVLTPQTSSDFIWMLYKQHQLRVSRREVLTPAHHHFWLGHWQVRLQLLWCVCCC